MEGAGVSFLGLRLSAIKMKKDKTRHNQNPMFTSTLEKNELWPYNMSQT